MIKVNVNTENSKSDKNFPSSNKITSRKSNFLSFFFQKFYASSLRCLQKFENYTLLLDGFPVRVCPVLPFSLKIRWIWCFSSSLTQSSSGFWLSVIQRFFYNNNKRASQRHVLICQPLLSNNHCFDEWPLLSVKIDPALFYKGAKP